MSGQATEFDALQQIMPELEAEGYEVFVQPRRSLLPKFLQSFIPDAIALRSDKNLAIEVIRESRVGEKKREKVAEIFEGRDDWELKVIWVTPAGPVMTLQSQTPSLIRTRIKEIRQLAEGKHFNPAFLIAWATFEAIARLLIPSKFERPQTPGRLVQVLASEGYITPTEADSLRLQAAKRNKLIHGDLKTRISKSEINKIADVLSMMVKMVGK